ncbi:MAG: 3-methyl-2-oxobutanoate hydroxymethyltransferase [Candidatus Accumulibacter sp.]|jgi:3-methyl-2-oxobutanoate hydroxymethyltransferase|nr:3-methyl-2-oxobutanoate hydroxymethyltransferase [Accumulibacter sp.]
MSAQSSTRQLTHLDLAKMRASGEKIVMLTCYDASFAQLCEAAGVDIVLIGDSLGNVIQGHTSSLPVTLDDILYHTRAVVRGCSRPMVVSDMPVGTFQESPQLAYRNAVKLMAAGAQVVKIEGGVTMAETTRFLVERGIPVCAHIGLTPQSVHQFGGFRVQGKGDSAAQRFLDDAKAQEDAGAALIVFEAVPAPVGEAATQALSIPTIGIGAGPVCSGQVLVLHDMLNIYPGRKPKFVRNFMDGQPSIAAAIAAYVAAVKDGSFPAAEHCY